MKNLLPEKLSALRKHWNYSQGDLAEKLKIPVYEYMNWENGNSICTITQLKQLAAIFHVPMQDLADNSRSVVLPHIDTVEDSVTIPFQNSLKSEVDAADNILPVSETQPAPQVDVPTQEDLGATRVMNTEQFEKTTVNQIVDEDSYEDEYEEEYEEEKPVHKTKPTSGKKSPKKNMTLWIVIGVVAAAVVVGLLWMLLGNKGGGSSTNSLGTVNRLALADKYSVYLDDHGNIITQGSSVPDVSGFSDTVQISSRGSHILGLTKDGTAECAGTSGTACDVTTWKDLTMVAAGNNHSVGLMKDGTVVCVGSDVACQVTTWKDVASIYAGNEITLGIKNDGSVVLSGTVNGSSKLTSLKNAKFISVGGSEIAVVTADGKINMFAIGSGSTSDTATWTSMTQAAVGDGFVAGLKNDGTVSISTDDDQLKETVESWRNVKYIAANGKTLVAITSDGKMYGIGDNTSNQYVNTAESAEASASPSASASASPSAGTKLATPGNPTYSVTTANLTINWTAVINADYYTVTVNTNPQTSIKAASNSTSVAANKLTDGATYTITITAIPKDKSGYAASETFTTTYTYKAQVVSKALGMPGNLGASQNGSHDMVITWTKVENADSYVVAVTANGAASPIYTNNSITDTSVTVPASNFANGTVYNVSVIAQSNDPSKFTPSTAASTSINYTYSTPAPTPTETPAPDCGEHGTYSPVSGTCTCVDGYTGDNCEIAPTPAP